MQRLKILLMIAIGSLLLAVPAAPVLAREGADDNAPDAVTIEKETEVRSTPTEINKNRGVEDKKRLLAESSKDKKEANKQKACQNREKSINNRMQNIAARGQKQLDLFTKIADRTQKFYTDNNLSLANYDELVAALNNQKAAAQSTVNQIKNDSVSFKCDGTDPKGALTIFKTDLKSEITALKNYRTAVKNLINGVKSVASDQTEQNNG